MLNENMYVVIFAGGSGTRLWPMSRQQMPKQFHILTGKRTLLQDSFDRVVAAVPPSRIFVLTTSQFKSETKKQLTELPENNILIEPIGRNTATASALSAYLIHQQNPDAIIAILPSDHVITKPERFLEALIDAIQVASQDEKAIVTLGIEPTYPHTGLGYIHKGEERTDISGLTHKAYKTKRFVEKPNLTTAKRYFRSGEYLWNGGYFVGHAKTLLDAIAAYEPDLIEKVKRYARADSAIEQRAVYETITPRQIDHALAERYPYIHVIPADIGWSDVGSWASLHEILKIETGGESVIKGDHVGIDTENVLILGHNKLIATVGLKDVIVVDTPDVMLICHKDKAQDIKKILEELTAQGRETYL
jgi:mannose-1-phosphate guanylyltransferase